nr:immunoglobulin light chain junction region [Macaca mulatta]MOY08151.1 immunoglobulin light chain junction region [Macaca mulatta]
DYHCMVWHNNAYWVF